MPSEDIKILEFNQYQKFDNASFVTYADLECMVEKIDGCKSNPENSTTAKVSKHIPSGFSISTISSFKSTENKHYIDKGKDCMKKFCESLREHAMKIINFKKRKMKLLKTSIRNHKKIQKSVIFVKKKFENKYMEDKKYRKVRDHCHYTRQYRGASHSICNLKYRVHKKNPVVFYNGSNYDDHFIIKELAKQFEKQLLL